MGIVARDLTKVYVTRKRQGFLRSSREEKLAVDSLSLEIPEGRITGLLGLNGAGKTTTIKMLTTLLLPTRGEARIDELDLVRDAAAVRRRVNLIAGGERMLYWRLTGRENLWYFAQLYEVEPGRVRSRIDELLELVGLMDAADTPVERYSKGMKQRLQIARGLINDPRYLFMDEPTLGLDAPIARQLRRVTRDLARDRGKGILLTSHYMAEVEELCDFIYVIDRGRMIAQGTADDLKALTHQERVLRMAVSALTPEVSRALQVLADERGARLEVENAEGGAQVALRSPRDLTQEAVAAVTGAGERILRLDSAEASLEDAILALAASAGTAGEDGTDAAD